MGEWFGTCAITQIPIKEDEETVCFIMRTHDVAKHVIGGKGGFSESNDLYLPITLPLFGLYDGVGKIKDIKNKNHIKDAVQDQLIKDFKKRNINDQDLKINVGYAYDFSTLESILMHIERGHIAQYSFMLVHKEAYELMINEFNTRSSVWSGRLPLRQFLETDIDVFINREDTSILGLSMMSIPHEIEYSRFYKAFKYERDYYLIEDRAMVFRDLIIDLLIFEEAMSVSRKLWIPQAGSGSTDDEYVMHSILGRFADKKLQEVHDEYQEHSMDYDDVKDSLGKSNA